MWSISENETVTRHTVFIQHNLKVVKDLLVALKFEHLKAKKETEFGESSDAAHISRTSTVTSTLSRT